jgi:hypothetical protein
MTAMATYVRKLKLQSQSAGKVFEENLYSNCLENLRSLIVSQTASVSLTFAAFQDKNADKEHLVQCIDNWRGKGARSDFIFFQNKVVGSR